ncbi:MAG: YdcF family protein [Saprospiraceae bacterium]|nr:YdcF family protein [Saprospiraceae bacterium]
MFFIFSKILAFLIKPLNMLLFLALGAVFVRSLHWKKRLGTAMVILLFLFSNPWIIQQISRFQEPPPLQIAHQNWETAVVLGGFCNLRAESPDSLLALNRSSQRLTAALQLYHMGKVQRILISGGGGFPFNDTPAEAPVAAAFLRSCGVPDSAIIIEDKSRNTRENALYTLEKMDSLALSHEVLLITSAWHMRRAGACYRKVGLTVTPFCVDYFYENKGKSVLQWLEPDWQALMRWEVLLKEWIGVVVYRISGYL